jgi:hypothetical protein
MAVNLSGLQQPARPGRGVPAASRGRARVGRRGKMWPSAQGADTARARSARLAPPALGHSGTRRRGLWAWPACSLFLEGNQAVVESKQ